MKRAFFILGNCPGVVRRCLRSSADGSRHRCSRPDDGVPFGCDARAPNVCHFRIFYTRGDRIVILPAGMKENKVPATIGGHYCMTLDKSPAYKCTRKVINDKYNS